MIKLSKKQRTGIAAGIVGIGAIGIFLVGYLKILPDIVSNPKVISLVEKTAHDVLNLNLKIKNPELITSFAPEFEFKVDELALVRDDEDVFGVDNFDIVISFKEILKKNIAIKKLGADYIFADINKLTSLSCDEKEETPKKLDWNIDLYDSFLYVKKSKFLYKVEPSTYITFNANDISIDNTQKDLRYVHFNLISDIYNGDSKLHFDIADRNSVFFKDKKFHIQKCYLAMNKSKIYFNVLADKKKHFNFEFFSDGIDMSDVLTLINSNIVENNLNEPLSYFKDLNGIFNFNIKLSDNDLNGVVNLSKFSGKIVPIADIPVTLDKGKILITNKDILLEDFEGYYNNRRENKIDFEGSVKDYLKSIDTNITARAIVTNDFVKNYLSKLAGIPLEMVGGESKTKVELKSINNKIDIKWLFGLKKGQDLLVDGISLTPANYLRGLKSDMHFEDNILDINSIDYYIAPEEVVKEHKKIQPVMKLSGQFDCAKGDYKTLGFEMPRALPSEFLNIFVGEKFFKGGQVAGKMFVDNTGKFPILDGRLTMDKVRIPSQRVFLKHGEMFTDNGLLKLLAEGKYRRSSYDLNGSLVNEIKFPIVVKNINLNVDDVDIEKFIASANNQSSQTITSEKMDLKPSGTAKNDDDDTPTFDIGNFIVEDCNLNIQKGKYKDIQFKDVRAELTLDKNSILNLQSNLFEFAEGYTNAKVNCDLKKHKYYVRLGIKDVDSDVLASNLLSLNREISGKAKGLIELNTDDSLKLNGAIKFLVENGTIQKVGLVEYIFKFVSVFRNPVASISPSIFSDMVNIPEGNFDTISGDLLIKDNVVERMAIKSSSPHLSAYIAGKYNLENSDVALRIYTKFSNKRKGFAGALRSISLNSLANRMPMNTRNDAHYYEAELSQLPALDADEKDCQIFLTKVDGDLEYNNFISSLKKLK